MRNKKIRIIILVIVVLMLCNIPTMAGEIDRNAVEVTQDVNSFLFGFIEFLQWIITAVMIIVAILGILPELFTSGRPPDLAGMFMKFIQAAFIIGITWAIGDFIFWVFGTNIQEALIM